MTDQTNEVPGITARDFDRPDYTSTNAQTHDTGTDRQEPTARPCVVCGTPTGHTSGSGHPCCFECQTGAVAQAVGDSLDHLRRFVIFADDHQANACALFAVYSHAADVFDVAVYLAVTAPEKQSGKTRLLEALEPLCADPIRTSNISPAALYRVVDDRHPVLLVDEADTIFGKGERAEELRGLMNAGHRKGNPVYRMKGARGTELASFDPFCPKVIAAIGDLPDTIADRSITIRLQRKRPDEEVARFRIRYHVPAGRKIGERIAQVMEYHRDVLAGATPPIPDGLADRAVDVWEPLLAVADLAGGAWPERARLAASVLSGADSVTTEETVSLRLLADIRDVWGDDDRLASAILADRLAALPEAPWGDWYGKALSPHKLARMLTKYGIHSKTMLLPSGERLKGYERVSFEDSWGRYLSPSDVSNRYAVIPSVGIDENGDSQSVTGPESNALKNPENPITTGEVTRLRIETPEPRNGEVEEPFLCDWCGKPAEAFTPEGIPACIDCAADRVTPITEQVCAVCDRPGDLEVIRGGPMHPKCAPKGWTP